MFIYIAKKSHVIITVFLVILSLILMVILIKHNIADTKDSIYIIEKQNTKLKTIKTESYTINAPKEWNVKEFPYNVPELDFIKNGKRVGWLWVLGEIVFGNHYEIVDRKYIKLSSESVLMVRLLRQKPAAIADNTETRELHFYVSDPMNTRIYDIAFLSDYVDYLTAINIVNSFKINK